MLRHTIMIPNRGAFLTFWTLFHYNTILTLFIVIYNDICIFCIILDITVIKYVLLVFLECNVLIRVGRQLWCGFYFNTLNECIVKFPTVMISTASTFSSTRLGSIERLNLITVQSLTASCRHSWVYNDYKSINTHFYCWNIIDFTEADTE